MRFTQSQHLEMSRRLHERAKKNPDPEKAKKQAAMANVFKLLAAKAAKQGAESTRRRRPATSQGPSVDHNGWDQSVAIIQEI
jgi:hypothetical protein